MNHIAQRLRSLAARTALDGIAEEMRAIADELVLAQQAQEPVGVVCGHESSYHRSQLSVSLLRFVKPGAKLYTTPPAPQPAPVDEREAFEASMREKHGWVARDFQSDSFGYFDGHTATAWLAWQARAALQSPSPKTKGQP